MLPWIIIIFPALLNLTIVFEDIVLFNGKRTATYIRMRRLSSDLVLFIFLFFLLSKFSSISI